MLSQIEKQGKLSEKKRVKSLPEIVPPRAIRLKFCKVGTLQYISHLDLQRTFTRIINRACLPVWYTKGFNPHIKMVFSTPLSVGTQSLCEYLDIRIDREMSCEEIVQRLNVEMTDEFYITEAYFPSTDFSQIKWAEYKIKIKTQNADEKLAEQIEKTLTTSPLTLTKRTKAGEKDVDIIPLIYSVSAVYNSNTEEIEIDTTVKAASDEYLNPEMIITGLKDKLNILSGVPTEEYYSIVRTALLKDDMTYFK